MTAPRVIDRPVMATVMIPSPEQVAKDVMALHHVLELLIADLSHTPHPLAGLNASLSSKVLPILNNVSEQARRAACNIDHLATGR
jgi:hypothetical protein